MFNEDLTPTSVKKRLKEFTIDLNERSHLFIGYPVASDFNYSELYPLFNNFMNNIGDPNVPALCRVNSKEMEREVISFYASLLRAPKNDTWGYVTSGSTEGNLYGLWVARERYEDGIVYHSDASHYSVPKNAHILRMPAVIVKTQSHGELDYEDLRLHVRKNNAHPAIVVANIGTTMTEARDDIGKIQHILKESGVKDYHIHCDGALTGTYASFIEPRPSFDFADGADSMTVSAYKFLGLPEPCGIVLVKESQRVTRSDNVSYIANPDSTVSGSRSGHIPLMIWYRLMQLGTEGIRMRYQQSVEMAMYTQHALEELNWSTWRNPGAITVMLASPPAELTYKWQLATQHEWSHVLCMPGITKDRIDLFISELRTIVKKS